MSLDEIVYGFIKGEKKKNLLFVKNFFLSVANEAMARPIRNITESRGYDARNHVLACFGGAGKKKKFLLIFVIFFFFSGGQHACAIARSLGMKVENFTENFHI
jgi:5-oxoprolinase (ATP-hydrolysing)